MVDETLNHGKPGIADFETRTYGGPLEPRYGEGVATTTHMTITAPSGGLELPIYSVIADDGTLAVIDSGDSNAYGILATPIMLAEGESMSIPVYREGTFDMDVLNWDATFTTDALKTTAFEGGASPTIFIQRGLHKPDAINL